MRLKVVAKISIICVSALLCIMLISPLAKATPDPVEVSWYITDGSGNPVNGALLTIYYAYSPNGPFTEMPADNGLTGNAHWFVLDKVNGATASPPGPATYQNPIISGYWNPDHPAGMAVADVHPNGDLNVLYFYVKIEFDTTVLYWPQSSSIKPGDPTWIPVPSTGPDKSPSGYAAAGPGIGNGPTTAYNIIPEVLGPLVAGVSMAVGLVAYVGLRRRKAIGFR